MCHIIHVADRLSMLFTTNQLVVAMETNTNNWRIEGEKRWMRGKGSYVADKEVESTQVDRMDSVRCVYRRRSLPVHSDHTADHSHCSCCSVHSRSLKTGHGYSRLLMRTCKYGCWVEHNLPAQWWCHYSCTNYRDKSSLKNVNGYRKWKSVCICTFGNFVNHLTAS